MCQIWPCCATDDYNIRRYDYDGNILWDYFWDHTLSAAIAGPSNSTIVLGCKKPVYDSTIDYAAETDAICFSSSGSIIWTANIANAIETLTPLKQNSGGAVYQGVQGYAATGVMLSTNEVVVFCNYGGNYGSGSLQWARAAVIDPTDGTITSSTGRQNYIAFRSRRAIAGGGTVFAGDTAFAQYYSVGTGAYYGGNMYSVASPETGSVAGLDTGMAWTTGILVDSGSGPYVLNDNDESWAFKYDSTTNRNKHRFGSHLGAASATGTVESPSIPSAVGESDMAIAGIGDYDYPVNYMLAPVYANTQANWIPNGANTICRIDSATVAITALLVKKANGYPQASYMPLVDHNSARAGEFCCIIDNGSRPGTARISAAGVWKWYHYHPGAYPFCMALNGDLIAIYKDPYTPTGAGAPRRNDLSYMAFP